MGRRLKGNGVAVDKDGYIHIEVNGCRIVLPPAAPREAKTVDKARLRQTKIRFPKALEAAAQG